MTRWMQGLAVIVAAVAVVMSMILAGSTRRPVIGATGGPALSGRLTASATKTPHPGASRRPVIESQILEADFFQRLRSAGEPPRSVVCQPDLVVRQGAGSRCDATFRPTGWPAVDHARRTRHGWLADRADYIVTEVEGSTASYGITPGLRTGHLENALAQLLSTASYLKCPETGMRGRVGEIVSCQATYGDRGGPCVINVQLARCTLFVHVDRVTGLALELRIAHVTPPAVR